ncbi:MAG: ribosome maturation factor RimM [Eubacteriales bacterium]|nr:ribosome maturation factor RimM [Eubacteriales bacterium]
MARQLQKYIYVAQILAPHGVRGAFKINLLSEDVDRLKNLKTAYLVHPKRESEALPCIISLAGRKPETLILSCDRIMSREDVAKYRFWYIAVERSQARELPEGEYFVCDLIGCEVYDQVHGYLGTVRDVIDQGAQMLYRIEKADSADLYFPAHPSFVEKTDIEAGRIDVILAPGLYELYRPTPEVDEAKDE